jgi:outer membrane biosynthesis protein TonB
MKTFIYALSFVSLIMNKTTLQIIYMAFVLVMMSLFISSTSFLFEVGKLFLLIVLSFALITISTKKKGSSVYHQFNILFALAMIVFVIYVLVLQGSLYANVRLEFLALSLVGFAMSLLYSPKKRRVQRKMTPPPKPAPIKEKVVVKEVIVTKQPIVKKEVKKKVKSSKPKKVLIKKLSTPHKPTRRMVRNGSTKTTKTIKSSSKKSSNKVVKKISKKSAKKSTKKRSGVSQDRNLISFGVDHEVAYVLRKFNKRITKKNKEKLVEFGKKFKSLKSYKPHNRKSFYTFMEDKKVLSKLD